MERGGSQSLGLEVERFRVWFPSLLRFFARGVVHATQQQLQAWPRECRPSAKLFVWQPVMTGCQQILAVKTVRRPEQLRGAELLKPPFGGTRLHACTHP